MADDKASDSGRSGSSDRRLIDEANRKALERDPVSTTRRESEWKQTSDIPKSVAEIRKALQEKMGLDVSFDVIYREMTVGGRDAAVLVLNGFVNDVTVATVLHRLSLAREEDLRPSVLQTVVRELIPHAQVEVTSDFDEAVDAALVGQLVLFLGHEEKAVLVDTRKYPARSVDEPDLERVVRGSRDGFVETLLTNVTLVRRRLRDPRLTFEVMRVGERTKTHIAVGYIRDIADPDLVRAIKRRIAEVKVDGLPVAEKQLEESLIRQSWNPFPNVRYSERPDVVCAHLLEGHVIVFVDTSPSVMMLPSTYFHHLQHAEEYRQSPFVGTYLRWVRYFGVLVSLFLLPLWFLVVHMPVKPEGLEFLGPAKPGKVPLLLQFVLIELGIDLMRMAAVHTPSPLTTAMGLVAAILIGEIAVKTGLFNNEVILMMSVAAVGMFATPSYELSLGNRIVRLSLLLAAGFFGACGFGVAAAVWLTFLATRRSYGSPYLWPFIPFNFRALVDVLLRRPVRLQGDRPSVTRPVDPSRQPS